MRLAIKLTFAFLIVSVILLALHENTRVERARAHFEEERNRTHKLLGDSLAGALSQIPTAQGPEMIQKMLDRTLPGDAHIGARLVCIDIQKQWDQGADCQRVRELSNGQIHTSFSTDDPKEKVHITYVPFIMASNTIGAIELREGLDEEDAFVQRSLKDSATTVIILAATFTAAAFLFGFFFIAVPIRRLEEKARRTGLGDLNYPIGKLPKDELGELGQEMNRMCEMLASARDTLQRETQARIRALDQLRHAERLTTAGKLASGLAHEVGTPLNTIEARASMIADGSVSGEKIREYAQSIVTAVERITRIVRALLTFARGMPASPGEVDLKKLIDTTIDLVGPGASRRSVKIQSDIQDPLPTIRGDEVQLSQAITNILMNAVDASPEDSVVFIQVCTVDAKPPEDTLASPGIFARISIEDRGPGIDSSIRQHVFEPFFTTKPVGKGTGLGLAMAWGIAREHGGFIVVDDVPGGGVVFRLYLPAQKNGTSS